jgi:Protein of unknown function (DUF1552)
MNRNGNFAMNRRIFLRGVGGLTLAAPFLSSLNEAKGQAAAATDPKRLVIFYTHNGCLTDRWFPKVENGPLTAADLTGTLAPLAPYVSKLLLPRGFRSMNAYAQGQTIDPHDQACGSKLTCAPISTDSNRYGTAESLDHTVAKQINPNKNTPLVLSVGAASTKVKEVISFSGPSAAFPANVNPQTVFNALTLGTGMTPTPTGPTPTMPAAVDYHVQRGQSAIDLVRGDLTRLQKLKMSSADGVRLQNWLDLLRDTEVGVGGMTGGTGGGTTTTTAMPAACNADSATALGVTTAALTAASPTGKITGGTTSFGAPPAPSATNEGDVNLATSFTKGGDMMMNLMALNMICDANRVFVFLYPGYVVYNWDGMAFTHDHHGLSHRTGDNSVGGSCGVTGVLDQINQIDQWLAGKFAKLVGLLDGIQEGTGTLLDNTATMWLSELSDGAAHNLNNLPILIAGSAGGYLKQGAAVNVESATKNIDNGGSDNSCANGGSIGNTGSTGGNVPINKLYVTLMNAVGCTDNGAKVTQFGVMDGTNANPGISNPGEVTGLTAAG